MKKAIANLFLLFMICSLVSAQTYKFDFGKGKMDKGFIQITPQTLYSESLGYGIDFGTKAVANSSVGKKPMTDGFLTSDNPFYFSVKLPEGNYNLAITVGDDQGLSDLAVRAENRRMFVNRLQTAKGKHRVIHCTVNIRDSLIAGSKQKVKIKERERNYFHWDDKLTLEFNGSLPKINAVEITPNKEAVSVFLAGNSTVVDGAYEPFSAWGQMFPYFFQARKVAIVNLAESGETLKSFIAARRFNKLLSMMKPGDYAFVEFGHNDQKQKGEGVGAFTTYTKDLNFFIDQVRKQGGIPVLVTSVQRRRFENGKIVETLGDYPEAVRRVAKERKTALIDLNALSKTMLESMGEQESEGIFAHFPAGTFPNRDKPIADNTHFRPYGAYEISKLIVTGVRQAKLELAKYLKSDLPVFEPTKPGAIKDFYWPESPAKDATKPDGN
ncbi:MAG TPA: rhamnogalacturonan acetylesterase [Niabella sp.]|nr:rhamnogalacturonan acetylesterase [Niabella sp.]HOZ96842.1 rhamnogalacturonan acetylesterase [Niabella sp.]HQW15050.1 rhamnogalacturonan acetylesterase [Niabella sp.]HQX20191.1 rhamnogalacturonan acetylesterase [Niabella sp.]HQX42696.1 rhamnogalacturonan acetylesterase [Niabella sp.]